ncbi:39K [Adoxophyes orana granulovirus]|uniref:39K n=1 Tax=Adoxophyes orana granulovirus TaxID=170617 RepID=Q7T9W6_GVAO|nr:39K [Adoxophyes orana granulovirus]AAP85686.1 39K [Adoxophyes orana granulovirus]AJA91689.1 PP31/39K [Adoxophyes orana granulovirus]
MQLIKNGGYDVAPDTEISNKNLIDVSYINNKDLIVNMFNNNQFKQMLMDKKILVNLRIDLDANDKKSIIKKKKTNQPYIINSFIIYTSFLSKANIKLVKDNKAWQLMADSSNQDGAAFRALIEHLEVCHKKLVIENNMGVVDNTKTTILRKSVIAYAHNIMIAAYNNTPIPEPVMLDFNSTEMSTKNYEICKNMYNEHTRFVEAIDLLKDFFKRHNLLKSSQDNNKTNENNEEEVEEEETFEEIPVHVARKRPGVVKKVNNKRRITADMVDDDNLQIN